MMSWRWVRTAIIRKQAYLTADQDRAIKRLAQARGVSEAEILRQAVTAYLEASGQRRGEDPYLPMIGLGSSGVGDGSVEHDDIYGRV